MPSSDYDIRRVTLGDVPDFIRLRGCMFEEVGFELGDLNATSATYFEHAIPSEEFIGILVLTSDEAPIGSAGMSLYTMPPKPIQPDGRFTYVSSVYVDTEHRKRGLAIWMMDTLIQIADEMGLVWLTLHASEAGRPLYESIGFKAWQKWDYTSQRSLSKSGKMATQSKSTPTTTRGLSCFHIRATNFGKI